MKVIGPCKNPVALLQILIKFHKKLWKKKEVFAVELQDLEKCHDFIKWLEMGGLW